jgi:nicotinate-nucleotide adenylyltransferase
MLRLPTFGDGQRIGLFGGSFNPAHQGHRSVALYALKRLQLDWVWWLLSPQNPLKETTETVAFEQRLQQTKTMANHPRFVVTDIEQQLQSRYTADTLLNLRPALRRGHFVWIMGADSLADLHRWRNWHWIADTLPIAVLARPGYTLRALGSPASHRYAFEQLPPEKAGLIATRKAPAWIFLSMPLRKESSTVIRAMGLEESFNPAK